MPELEELKDAGGGEDGDRDRRRAPSGADDEGEDAPQDLVEDAGEGIVDPMMGRAAVELAVVAEGDDDGQADGGCKARTGHK